jgi:hypothetical protein
MKLILQWVELWAWMASAFQKPEPLSPYPKKWECRDMNPDCLCWRRLAEDARLDQAANTVRRQFARHRRPGPASISPARRLELDAIARMSLRKVH